MQKSTTRTLRMRLPRSRWLRAVLTALAALALAAGVAVPALAQAGPGTITGSLTDDGMPVPDTGVELWSTDYGYYDYVATDENGAFTFTDVPPNDYTMTFSLSGSTTQYWPQQTTQDGAGVITVPEGGLVTIDETVAPHGSIAGVVTNAEGSPAPNQYVVAWDDDFNLISQGYTDEEGRYAFPYVWAGAYKIQFGGYGSPEQWAHQKTSWSEADTFAVAVGAELIVDEQLLPTGAIAGQLTDASGDPVPYAYVTAFNSSASQSGETDDEGNFRIVVRPGAYKIRFSVDGNDQYAHQKTTEEEADEFTVVAGADTIVNEELLGTGTVQGTLRDSSGQPVPDVRVSLSGGEDSAGRDRTDEAGQFSIEALPGTYRLSFRTDYGTQYAFGKSSAAEADPITIVGGETLVVEETLLPTGTITVTARDSATNEPIADFCAASLATPESCTDTGTALLELLPGTYDVYVSPLDPSYVVPESARVTVTGGSTQVLEFQVERGATLTTVVRDAATGEPVEGACLELIRPIKLHDQHDFGGTGCSQGDGVLTMTPVQPGVYNAFVTVYDDEYGSQWIGWNGGTGVQAKARLIIVESGETTAIPDIGLDPPGSVSGLVTDAVTGDPVPFTTVATSSFSSGAGAPDLSTFTDENGRYTLDGLGPYEWTLHFRNYRYASHFSGGTANRLLADFVPVRSGETTVYDTEMGKGTTVTGSVAVPAGTDLEFLRIIAYHALTGDELGSVDPTLGEAYAVPIAGPTLIRLQYVGGDAEGNVEGWYDREDAYLQSDVVLVPATGEKSVDITITNPSS